MEKITLATLPQATALQVFQQGKDHLLKQNSKSQRVNTFTARNTERSICAYRGDNNAACAAGCFMSDEEYEGMVCECHSWDELVRMGSVPREHKELISELQSIHDTYNVEQWPEQLATLEANVKNGYYDNAYLNP